MRRTCVSCLNKLLSRTLPPTHQHDLLIYQNSFSSWFRSTVSEASLESEYDSEASTNPSQKSECSKHTFRQTVSHRFQQDSESATHELLGVLESDQKRQLLFALAQSSLIKSTESPASVRELFKAADQSFPLGYLDEKEFEKALRWKKFHEHQERKRRGKLPATTSQLRRLVLATCVPYIGFGFLDNFIMITAGESIEHAFGFALGLSIMAAAALGNMISDVAGVCFQETIEQRVKKVRNFRPPELSRGQLTQLPVRVARTMGAVIGICIGCLLGMLPLLWFNDIPQIPNNQKEKTSAEIN